MFFPAISPATVTHDSHYLLALATLGDMTQIGSFLFMSYCPRWPRQVQVCYYHVSLALALLCLLPQWKHCLMACTTCLVCLVSTLCGCHKNVLGRGSAASSGHITKLEQSDNLLFFRYLWMRRKQDLFHLFSNLSKNATVHVRSFFRAFMRQILSM